MNDVSGFDRYLVTPAQLAQLRREGKTERPLWRTFGVLILSVLAGFGFVLLCFIILAICEIFSGVIAGEIMSFINQPNHTFIWIITLYVGIIWFILHRYSPESIGCKKPILREYLLGALVGFGFVFGAIGFEILARILVITGRSSTFRLLPWLLMLVFFCMQSFTEELIFRGVLIWSIARRRAAKGRKNAVLPSILLSAGLFTACHIGNGSMSPLLSTFLFGIFVSLYSLWRGNIWGAAAFHALWNFTQVNVFGFYPELDFLRVHLLSYFTRDFLPFQRWFLTVAERIGNPIFIFALILAIAFVWHRNRKRIAKAPPFEEIPDYTGSEFDHQNFSGAAYSKTYHKEAPSMKSHLNYTMLCDFYELTMANGYFQTEMADQICYFDVFFRSVPDEGGLAIAAGLEQVVDYIQNLHFDQEDIEFLRGKGCFCPEFLEYLKDFRFTGDIWAVPEGTPVFPMEPILTVRAKAMEAQFIETFILLTLNHQTLIATKASRIVRSAQGRPVSEFGSRRAQGPDAANLGARAAYIAGCAGTADTQADQLYGTPAGGTMAHSWVQMFPDEYTAFETYCRLYPHGATLLVDTYNVLKSGVPNAIKAFKNVLLPQGITSCAIRLDSGDLAYLSRKARKMLDDAGLTGCKIMASNSLDEYLIRDLLLQGACLDGFGVGERLITSKSAPVFGGVYKLAAVEDKDGNIIPKIKISENAAKITNPSFKKVYRLYSNTDGKAFADLITLHGEVIDESKPLELFDPVDTWKRKTFENFTAKELLVPIFQSGKLVYDLPSIEDIRAHCAHDLSLQWEEVKRFENPHNYYVDLSQKLWDLKQELLKERG